MKYMMFVVADPTATAEVEPSENDLTIDEWLAEVEREHRADTRSAPTDSRRSAG